MHIVDSAAYKIKTPLASILQEGFLGGAGFFIADSAVILPAKLIEMDIVVASGCV